MCEDAASQAACRADAPRAFEPASAEFVAAIEAGVGPRILATLTLANARAHDAVFVPPDNDAFWRFAISGFRPVHNLNFLPAHFGMPVLLGLPPSTYNVDVTVLHKALLGRYGEDAQSRRLSDDELCRHARARRVPRVIVLESLAATRTLDCRSGSSQP
jgi:hypothetical protein